MNEIVYITDNFNQVSLHDPSPEILEVYKHIPEINELDPRGFPMCRPLFSHSDVPSFLNAIPVKIDDFKWDREFIYSVMLHHNNGLAATHLNLIPEKILEQVRLGKCKLILDNTLEGHTVNWFLSAVYKSISELNLPANQIYYVTNNLYAEKDAKEYCDKLNIVDRINVISFMYNVKDVQRLKRLKHLPEKIDIQKEYEYKVKNKNYLRHWLKVNRTSRPERNLFMLFINQKNLYDKFKISFPELPTSFDYPEIFKQYCSEENFSSLIAKVPFDIDETDVTNHGEPGYGEGKFNADLPFQPQHYRDTFGSVVMCAFPFIDACHLHSSTFNPIYCGHPIIQFGPKGHLSELRKRGFKTFERWWNEDYDFIDDGWLRFNKVLEISEKITNLSIDQLLEMYKEMIPTLQHNSDLIQNYDIKKHLIDRIV